MRQFLLIVSFIIIFTGAWFFLASSSGPYGDENEHLDWGYGIAKTGSIQYTWQDRLCRVQVHNAKINRGLVPAYLCSLAFKVPGNPLLWCRAFMLFFTFLTFFIVVFYYHQRGVLTYQRMLTWTILFFCSAIVLDLSYYIRTYTMLGAVMTVTFILYWEALVQFRQNNKKKAVFLGALALIPMGISVIDQWQLQGIPAFAIAVITSIAAFDKRFSSITAWVKCRSGWLLAGIILIAPIVIRHLNVITWIQIGGEQVFGPYYSTYLDNIIGWLRLVLAINVGLGALGYVLKSEAPMTFDRWMFINGFLTGIICILYNDVNHVFYSKYVYLPVLMMIIGLSGMADEVGIKKSLRVRLLIIYVLINACLAWSNVFEHNNTKAAIEWLDAHMTKEDVLLTNTYPSLQYAGGQQLLPAAYFVTDKKDKEYIINLRKYLYFHPQGKIFYLYDDFYASRTWLCKVITGKDRYPATDLWSYLKIKIPSTIVLPGLRSCGLVEFDHAVLLNSLDELLKSGYKAQHPYKVKDFMKYLFNNHHLMGT